ncbi:hypothetical protein D3C72_1459300 [compost metagenome]
MASMEEYVAARAAYVTATSRLKEVSDLLVEVGRELGKENSTLTFSNTGVGLPMEYLQGPSLAAENFPTPKGIMEAISARASARTKMDNAWYSLSADAKAALQPPPR